MGPTAWIVLLWIAFAATHLGLASRRVQPAFEARLGRLGYQGLYSLVALALFVPLVWIYFENRHAGPVLWAVPVGPGLRALLYAGMLVGFAVAVVGLVRPSPASLVPGEPEARGVYRVTRHPLVLGLALVFALHLIPNGAASDVAFFGGFVLFSLAGTRHQDLRKLASGDPAFRAFYERTPYLPFTRRGALHGLREVSAPLAAGALAAGLLARWLHGSLWPH